MLKVILDIIFKVLVVLGFIFIFGSVFSLLGLPFFTRLDDWSKHSHAESIQMIKDGMVFIVVSIIYFKYIKPKLPKHKSKTPQYTICPNCKETFNYDDLKKGKCPYCKDVDTVDIEQYYKDNPEEKEKGN